MLKYLVAAALAAAGTILCVPAASARPVPAKAEAFAPTRFSVEVKGEGPDLILIPGLMSGREVWDGAAASLGGKYRIHRVQLSGFAGEPAAGNSEGAIVDGVVEQLAAYVAARGLKRPAVAGHSMGGLVAMTLAARHRDKVGRLLVVDALPFYSLLFGPDATVEAVAPRAAAFRDSVLAMDEAAWAASQPRTAATLVRTERARVRVIADALASDRAVAARAVHEVMTTDARPLLPAIRAPLTVLYATNAYAGEDRMGALYRAAYAGAPGARLIQVADSYHFIMDDQPRRFEALLAEFLAEGPSS